MKKHWGIWKLGINGAILVVGTMAMPYVIWSTRHIWPIWIVLPYLCKHLELEKRKCSK